MNLLSRLNKAPHIDISCPYNKMNCTRGGDSLIEIWTDHFDCPDETEYWYCIKDDILDMDALKAKRRYEIKKGIKNFTTKVIDPSRYREELYTVYVESLKGYKHNPIPISMSEFQNRINSWCKPECRLFGSFDNESGKLCGYSDVYLRHPYLPISSLKTIPQFERNGVNAALIYEICRYFEQDLRSGCYLCDGARNSMHETNFQNYLIKYFGFRRAYCELHLAYKWYVCPFVFLLFPMRKNLRFDTKIARELCALLKMEAWSRGMTE